MMTPKKTLSIVLLFAALSTHNSAQTRKLNSIKTIDLPTLSASDVNQLIPRTPFSLHNTNSNNDSITFNEIIFNPEIKLIDPDTFKLQTSIIHYDSSLVNRDSTRIIDIHAQDVVQSNVFRVYTKDKNAFIVFYGSIRVSGIEDYNGLESPTGGFNPYYILVGEDKYLGETTFNMSASQTRFGIYGTNKTDWGAINFHLEGDFRGEVSNAFRLRQAYGQFINVLAGQTWSVFGDPISIPWSVDIEGPSSSVNSRSVQIRYSNLINEGLRWMVSLEAPQVNYNQADSIEPIYQGFPDLAGRLKLMTKWGHLQGSFIVRKLGVRNISLKSAESMGFGGLLSFKYEFLERGVLLSQFVGGTGISRFIRTFRHTEIDMVFNPDKNTYEPLPVFGGFISLGNGWKPNIYSFLTAGFTSVKNKYYQSDDSFSHSANFSINTFWDVTQGFRVGAEYSFGSRVNKNNADGIANRISFIFYYSF